jgi:hypothetical protein
MREDLVEAVRAFCTQPLDALDQVGLQERAVLARALAGQLLGCADQALGELDARGQGRVVTDPGSDGPAQLESVHGWWRDAVVLTGQQAGRDLRRAQFLRELPLLGRAVLDGTLAPAQAAVLGRLAGAIPDQALRDSQTQLIAVAAPLNTDALNRFVTHLIATHCEPALDAEQGAAHARRYLQVRREQDGSVRGSFVLASEDAEVVLTVLEPLARRQGMADVRSAGQRRADALVEVFGAAAAWMDLPHAGGQRPQVSYVVTAEWCAGEQPPSLPERLASAGLHPAALSRFAADSAWTGPQTRARVESALCDARIGRLLLDSRGRVVSLEALTDGITPAQRRAVSIRDRSCVAKGCTRPPAFCDVHHLEHREHGGATSVANLALLCRRHHVLWHRGVVGLHDLHLPWLPDPEPERTHHDPWSHENRPLIA